MHSYGKTASVPGTATLICSAPSSVQLTGGDSVLWSLWANMPTQPGLVASPPRVFLDLQEPQLLVRAPPCSVLSVSAAKTK